jgi:hypothetical protein
MSEENQEVTIEPGAVPENTAALPETGEESPEKAGATGAPENVEETDEQKNERVQREAAEATAKRAEKQSRGVQKRIDELTADKHAERKRADELAEQNRRILALLEGKSGAPSGSAASSGEPVRDAYDSYDAYLRAVVKYDAAQEAKRLFEESQKAQREAQAKFTQEQSAQTMQRTYAQREAAIAKTIPDYHDVIDDSDVQIPQGVLNTIMRMNDGPLIAYHLAKQPELAQQFWDQPQDMHGIILGQLSATLKATSKVSNAPAPGKPAKTTPAASNSPPSDPKQYFAWAEKHMPK